MSLPWWKEPNSARRSLESGKAEAKMVHLESFQKYGQRRCGLQDCFSSNGRCWTLNVALLWFPHSSRWTCLTGSSSGQGLAPDQRGDWHLPGTDASSAPLWGESHQSERTVWGRAAPLLGSPSTSGPTLSHWDAEKRKTSQIQVSRFIKELQVLVLYSASEVCRNLFLFKSGHILKLNFQILLPITGP